jgi:hypothetical protein
MKKNSLNELFKRFILKDNNIIKVLLFILKPKLNNNNINFNHCSTFLLFI